MKKFLIILTAIVVIGISASLIYLFVFVHPSCYQDIDNIEHMREISDVIIPSFCNDQNTDIVYCLYDKSLYNWQSKYNLYRAKVKGYLIYYNNISIESRKSDKNDKLQYGNIIDKIIINEIEYNVSGISNQNVNYISIIFIYKDQYFSIDCRNDTYGTVLEYYNSVKEDLSLIVSDIVKQ